MIDPSQALGTAAQVAVTLAGFAGVVVVFGRRAVHEWSGVDRFRLRLLLTTSAQALANCMVGLLLLATSLEAHAIWLWSSVIAIVLYVPTTTIGLRSFRRLLPGDLDAAGASKPLFYGISALSLAGGVLQLYNIFAAREFWPFFFLIVSAILASTLQFVRMILAQPRME
jgi:hypothetical protein